MKQACSERSAAERRVEEAKKALQAWGMVGGGGGPIARKTSVEIRDIFSIWRCQFYVAMPW